MTSITPSLSQSVIFFDGVCSLCNGFIDFLIRRDKTGLFKMSPLQGQTAQKVLKGHVPEFGQLQSIVLASRHGFFVKSDAILQIFKELGGIGRLAALGYVIPRRLRNCLYDIVAQHRYAWFGKKSTCRVPTAEERARFLD